jgi:hypothetical protein
MHGIRWSEHDKYAAIDPDARIRIIYHKTIDGSKWVQTTIDLKTNKVLHNYTKGKGVMKE